MPFELGELVKVTLLYAERNKKLHHLRQKRLLEGEVFEYVPTTHKDRKKRFIRLKSIKPDKKRAEKLAEKYFLEYGTKIFITPINKFVTDEKGKHLLLDRFYLLMEK